MGIKFCFNKNLTRPLKSFQKTSLPIIFKGGMGTCVRERSHARVQVPVQECIVGIPNVFAPRRSTKTSNFHSRMPRRQDVASEASGL